MPLTAADQELLDAMKQRELSLKKRQRASNAIYHETLRYRRFVELVTAVALAIVVTGIFLAVATTFEDWTDTWHAAVLVLAISFLLGGFIGHSWLHTPSGRALMSRKGAQLNEKHSGDLHAGRRWQQFYYRREDISVFIPQILYVIESEQRVDSVDEALAFVKAHCHEDSLFKRRGLELFRTVVEQTDLVVISSTDESGQPSIRFMRFVTTDRPGVWFVTTAPDAPKVHEFDQGRVSLVTAPTESGGTISSNRVRVRRADQTFMDVADLYRAQVPRYLDGMTLEDQQRELVYELTLESARVDTWVDHELVVFTELGASADADNR